jgi:hypothetical protein
MMLAGNENEKNNSLAMLSAVLRENNCIKTTSN